MQDVLCWEFHGPGCTACPRVVETTIQSTTPRKHSDPEIWFSGGIALRLTTAWPCREYHWMFDEQETMP